MQKKIAAGYRRGKLQLPLRYFPKRPVLKFNKESNFTMNAFPLQLVDGAWIWN
jgi:hypothetical protein